MLVVHDWIAAWGGAERCLAEILQVFPEADLVVGLLGPGMRNFNVVTRRAAETWLARIPFARGHYRWFLPLEGLAFGTLRTTQYDLVVSSSAAFANMVAFTAPALLVSYCYSPPRYLWDLADVYRAHSSPVQRVTMALGTRPLRALDARAGARVDHFMAISQHVAKRIENAYGKGADVVYPPVSARRVQGRRARRGPFLLSLGRLVPYKRVDLAARAATLLGLDLVVAGDGPSRRAIERLAGPTVRFLGEVDEARAAELLSTCAAFVFCGEEDFGIAPLEANAHGAAVVYYNRGGLTETMVPGVTGVPFEEPTEEAVAAAINQCLRTRWSPEDLHANAERFSPARFRGEFLAIVNRLLAGAARSP